MGRWAKGTFFFFFVKKNGKWIKTIGIWDCGVFAGCIFGSIELPGSHQTTE
jgi:hypothetical protein